MGLLFLCWFSWSFSYWYAPQLLCILKFFYLKEKQSDAQWRWTCCFSVREMSRRQQRLCACFSFMAQVLKTLFKLQEAPELLCICLTRCGNTEDPIDNGIMVILYFIFQTGTVSTNQNSPMYRGWLLIPLTYFMEDATSHTVPLHFKQKVQGNEGRTT